MRPDPNITGEELKEDPKWSARQTLLFIVTSCAAFWLGLGAAVHYLPGAWL